MKTPITIIVLLSLAYGGDARAEYSTSDSVRSLFANLDQAKLPENLPKEHPDYPILVAAKALRADLEGDSKAVINLAEGLFLQQKFNISRTGSDANSELVVGNVGSFHLWRELLYLEAGRAYYRTNQFDRAVTFLRAVPDTSPFAVLARLELGWAFLRLKEIQATNENLGRLSSLTDRMTELQKNEFLLQRAYYDLETGDSAEAVKLAEDAGVRPGVNAELGGLRSKIVAQGKLTYYLTKSMEMPFAEKKKLLEDILREVETIPNRLRDADFSFLAGETYWHLASVLRIENPDAFKTQSAQALKRANEWLTPWVEKSMEDGKPYFTEDGFFLSVAVLWEQRRYDAAIPRLLAMPKYFPKGEFLQDAYQLLADFYFDSGEFDRALRYYTRLAEIGNTEKAAYGVYKAAWTFYNQEEKWKALRHLERLLMHYKEDVAKNTDPNATAPNLTLLRESENDMLLIMAELLPFRQALGELTIFEFPDEKRIAVAERLGVVYKEIGRYEDSIAVLQSLLAEQAKNKSSSDRVYRWLGQMLVAQLSSGRREQIANSLDRFLPMLPEPSSDEGRKLHEEMEKNIVAITLTVHREAKKTDDADIWRAADAIYKSVVTHYPNCKDPELWYYGAQRKEQIGQKHDAMLWYRRSGSVEKYASRQDAALNSLRLARDIGNDKNAKNVNYAELSDVASWYLDNYRNTKEKSLAEFMLLEFSDKVKDWKKTHDYMIAAIQADGFTQEHQDQYLAHNKRLYEAMAWDHGYILATDLVKMIPKDAKPEIVAFERKLNGFQQETAFQAAFAAEKPGKNGAKPGPEALEIARQWYDRAIQTPADSNVTLKAWHNSLMTYSLPAEAAKVIERFREFEAKYPSAKGYGKEKLALILSVYAHAAEAWDATGQPVRRAEILSRAAQFQIDPAKATAMRWEALTTFGTYYQINRMKGEISALRQEHPATLNDPKNQLTIARLLFWNADYSEAWNMARSLAELEDTPAQTWVLIGDLFNFTHKMKNIGQGPIYAQIRDYLANHGKKIAGIAVLQPILVEVLYPKMDMRTLASLDELDREPAAAQEKKTPGAELKARVESIAKTLQALEKQQSVLQSYTKSPASQIAVAGLCAAPLLKSEVIRRLEGFKRNPIASPQWKDFVARVNTKIGELAGIAAQEQTSCDQQRKTIAYMKPNQEIISPLCNEYSCYPTVPSKMEEILSFEEERRKTPSTRLDDVRRYLTIGAWAPAEITAYQATSPKERALLLAYIRVAMGDTWNAAPLLKEASTDPAQAPHAHLILAAIAWRHGHFDLAASQLNQIRGNVKLLDWEEKIFDQVRSSLPERTAG